LESAQADFLKLQQRYTNSYRIAYNLGDIAWRTGDTNAAIRNFQIYLANAPTNTPEASLVKERLEELKQ